MNTETFPQVLDMFLKGQTGHAKRDADSVYTATKNALVIRTYHPNELVENILVARVNNKFVGNSSLLNHYKVLPEQIDLQNKVPMIPFSVLKEAGLSLSTYLELDQSPEETLYLKQARHYVSESELEKIKLNNKNVVSTKDGNKFDVTYDEPRHFMGARLFSVQGKIFLLDVDREELKHGIINPFLVEIPHAVKTIKEAYDSLVPQEVKDAIEATTPVKRQGEYFFVKISNSNALEPDKANDRGTFLKECRLSAQGNRDHVCSRFNEKSGLVSGKVRHQGREHKDLDLTDGWYKPVPNTAVRSFTITGDVD